MKKLYDVTITFDPASYDGPVESVAVRGEFLFYESGLTGHTDKTGMVDCDKKYTPHQYAEGLDSIWPVLRGDAKGRPRLVPGEFPPARRGVPLPLPHQSPVWEPSTHPPVFSWSNMTMADGSQKGLQNLEAALACGFLGPENHVMPDPKIPR